MIRAGIYLTLTLILALIIALTSCTSEKAVHHRGLASYGHDFIKNSPSLPPPEHLTKAS